jgi:hypothetical protein
MPQPLRVFENEVPKVEINSLELSLLEKLTASQLLKQLPTQPEGSLLCDKPK